MNWTTEKPTKHGYYWAYEKGDECDADIYIIYINENLLQIGKCLQLGVKSNLDDFSYFMGPIEVPKEPIL